MISEFTRTILVNTPIGTTPIPIDRDCVLVNCGIISNGLGVIYLSRDPAQQDLNSFIIQVPPFSSLQNIAAELRKGEVIYAKSDTNVFCQLIFRDILAEPIS